MTFSTFSELSGYSLSFLRVELAILRNLNTTIVSHDRTWWLVLSDEILIRSERNMRSKISCGLQETISTPRTDRVHSHVLVCFSAEVYTSDRLSNFQQNTHLLQQVRPSRDRQQDGSNLGPLAERRGKNWSLECGRGARCQMD